MRAAGLVNGARLDEPELAEHGQAAGRRGGAHGAESVGGGLGQIGVGHAEVVVGSVALQRAQLAVHLGHDVMIRRGVGQDALVDGGVPAPVEQMHPRRLPIAPGPAAHLVELHVAEGQMIQHHVPDVGNVDPFPEGRGGHEHLQVVATEQLLDALALVAGEPRVVEADHAGELRHPPAQHARERHGMLAGVHIDDGLLARGHQGGQIVVAVRDVSLVVQVQVVASRLVDDRVLNGQYRIDVVGHGVVGRGGHREHHGVSEPGQRPVELGVGHALAGLGLADVVRFVHDDEPDAPRGRQLVGVEHEVLRRGEHDIETPVGQPRVHRRALLGRRLAGDDGAHDAEALEARPQVEHLVGDERPQGVDEQARGMVGQRAEGGIGLEAQRLAASRGHDGEGGLPRPQPIENLSLGRMQRAVADDGLHNGRLQAVRIAPGRLLPLGAAGGQVGQRRLGRLVGGRKVGFPFRLGEQIGGERHGVRVETGLQSAAAARRGHGFQHGLHRAAAAPFVDLHREGGVHHRVVHEQRVDGRAVEHDAGHRCAPVRQRAGEMVLGLAHGPGVHERHVPREEGGLGVLLAEGGEPLHERHGFERQLVQAHERVHLGQRMEGRLRQLLHIGVEALSEGLQIFGGDGDAHGRPMAPEALREIRDRLHRLEEIHVAHGAPRAAGLVAVDGEQERRHPVGVHEAGSHDTLHALVPALAGHDKRPLAVVDPAGLLLRDVRQLRLDGAPLVVHVLQGLGHGATLAVVVAHEQIKRQIGIAHAPGGVQARDEGERQVRGRKRFAGLARGGQKRGDAGARIGVHASEAVGHKGPVLVAHGHEVGHGAQGGEVGVAAPQMRKAQAAAEHLHEL